MNRERALVRIPRRCLLALAALASVSAVGCTLLLVSTDGLAGGADADGAPPSADGGDGAARSGPDADADSGGALADGGDAAGGDAAPVGYCVANPGHTLCDDFDDRADVAVGWQTTALGRGSIVSDVTLARSAPRSFAAQTTAGAAMVSNVGLARSLGSVDHVRLAFDFYVTPPSGAVGDSIATINFPGGYLDVVWFQSGELRVTERGASILDHIATQPLAARQWVRVQVEVTPGHIVASLGGTTVLDTTTPRTYSGAASISLGIYSNDAYAIAFNFDNVVVDTSF